MSILSNLVKKKVGKIGKGNESRYQILRKMKKDFDCL